MDLPFNKTNYAARGIDASNKRAYPIYPCLNEGFIYLVDYMGADEDIVEAARTSYQGGTKKVNEDAGLINYLLRHKHTTPFEMVEFKFHVKLPIFVARQWIRHRTANVNEMSARYSILDKEYYIPKPEHLAPQSKTNKQGRDIKCLEGDEAQYVLDTLKMDAERAYNHYRTMLNEDENGDQYNEARQGLARELARMNLPVNFYTQWYWKVNLHNLMNFLRLRMDSHAQYEIRVYANAMAEIVKAVCPLAWNAFEEYVLYSQTFSRRELAIIKKMLAFAPAASERTPADGFSKGEWAEFIKKIA